MCMIPLSVRVMALDLVNNVMDEKGNFICNISPGYRSI